MPTRTAALAALFTSIAITFVFTGSAFAGWFIEGEGLTSTAALSTTLPVEATSALLVPNLKLTIVCGGSTIDATTPALTSSGLAASSLSFLLCNTTVPATGCALLEKNQKINTNSITALVAEGPTFPEDRLVFTPKTGTTLASISFNEANTCAFNSEEPVKGAVKFKAPSLQEELTTQPIEGLGSVENNSLEIGAGNKTFIDGGKAQLKLASGQEFVGLFNKPAVKIGLVMPTNGKLTFAAKNAEGTIEYKNEEMAGGASWNTSEGDITDGGEYTISNNECVTKLVIKPQGSCKFKVKLIVAPTGKKRLFFTHEAPLVSLAS